MSPAVASPVVDAATALQFRELIRELADDAVLDSIAAGLADKGARLRAALAPAALAEMDAGGLQALLRSVLATRRRSRDLLGAPDAGLLRAELARLLHGPGAPAGRLEAFTQRLDGWGRPGPPVARDFGADLLRHLDPAGGWPWSRWVWDPETGKGAARLVAPETHSLRGRGVGDTYRRVGEVAAGLRTLTPDDGFWPGLTGDYGPDVFLACIYAVYTYAVLSTQMTREFNKVIPDLPALARRLLGIHRVEVS